MSTHPAELRPATTSTPPRMRNVDGLRGFALFGILIVNIAYFASGYAFHGVTDPAFDSPLDHGVRAVVTLLFEMKFYLLFSFLFGYSFTLQTASADRAGAAFRPRHFRRLAGLFLLGALHAVLLFQGDILTTYALLGLLLYALRGVRTRTALITAAVLVGWVVLLFTSMAVAGLTAVDESAALADGRATTEAFSGGLGSVIAGRFEMLPRMAAGLLFQQAPTALAMFLLGLVAGRHRVMAHIPAHTRLLSRVQYAGFPIGLTGAVLLTALGGPHSLTGVAITSLTAPFLAAAYAATVLRLFETTRGTKLMNALAPAGRMALTNYLAQSLICVLIFTGIGAGLVGSLSPLTVLGIAVVIFVSQMLLSAYWLRRHRYGPVEWALRAFSYRGVRRTAP
ncbi:DUF418 domain-containing protein [Streptomyces gobiensis]|uniref:DUF418 domain-containing protein n=1 Tax=Streptomyces gobiensis TaxID=2875706 RepID=UPI001E5D153C|nr:DUF418 domain-containing protein [Streptomyces gobiensis]UGY94241.1 DUF418 domain-containing protein [Streptomyces gobiensis]